MKKIMFTLLAFAMAAFTLTSCEDVPAPYEIPGGGNGGGDTPATEVAEGDGTVASPFNIIAVNDFIKAGEGLDKTVYIKGIISEVKECSANFGNATFYITSDGTTDKTSFYVYRVKGLNNQKITSDEAVKVGDEVVICSTVTNYNGTYETVQNAGYIYSLNGKTSEGGDTPSTGEAKGDGSKENPFNSVAANKAASALASGVESDKEYYIKGKVCEVKEAFSTNYNNASFYITDDGTSTSDKFYCFRVLYLGNVKYTEGTNIAVGDEVVVCAKLVNYMGNTPETVQNAGYLVELKSNGGGSETPSDDLKGDVVYAASSCGLANTENLTSVTVSDDVTLTFKDGGGSYAPKYYTSGLSFRMYPSNTMTFTSKKKIASVIILCNEASGNIYNASGNVTTTAGKVTTEGKNITISGIDATEFTFADASTTTGAVSQVRIQKIAINFAK